MNRGHQRRPHHPRPNQPTPPPTQPLTVTLAAHAPDPDWEHRADVRAIKAVLRGNIALQRLRPTLPVELAADMTTVILHHTTWTEFWRWAHALRLHGDPDTPIWHPGNWISNGPILECGWYDHNTTMGVRALIDLRDLPHAPQPAPSRPRDQRPAAPVNIRRESDRLFATLWPNTVSDGMLQVASIQATHPDTRDDTIDVIHGHDHATWIAELRDTTYRRFLRWAELLHLPKYQWSVDASVTDDGQRWVVYTSRHRSGFLLRATVRIHT